MPAVVNLRCIMLGEYGQVHSVIGAPAETTAAAHLGIVVHFLVLFIIKNRKIKKTRSRTGSSSGGCSSSSSSDGRSSRHSRRGRR